MFVSASKHAMPRMGTGRLAWVHIEGAVDRRFGSVRALFADVLGGQPYQHRHPERYHLEVNQSPAVDSIAPQHRLLVWLLLAGRGPPAPSASSVYPSTRPSRCRYSAVSTSLPSQS